MPVSLQMPHRGLVSGLEDTQSCEVPLLKQETPRTSTGPCGRHGETRKAQKHLPSFAYEVLQEKGCNGPQEYLPTNGTPFVYARYHRSKSEGAGRLLLPVWNQSLDALRGAPAQQQPSCSHRPL